MWYIFWQVFTNLQCDIFFWQENLQTISVMYFFNARVFMILQHDVFWTGGSSWGPGTNASEHPWLSRGRQLLIIDGHHHTVPQVTRRMQTHFSQATGFTGPGQLEVSWKNQPSDLHTRLVSCDPQKQWTAARLVSETVYSLQGWSLMTLKSNVQLTAWTAAAVVHHSGVQQVYLQTLYPVYTQLVGVQSLSSRRPLLVQL